MDRFTLVGLAFVLIGGGYLVWADRTRASRIEREAVGCLFAMAFFVLMLVILVAQGSIGFRRFELKHCTLGRGD